MKKRIYITPGEPAGIGPDIVLKLWQQKALQDCIVVADPELLQQRADALGISLSLQCWKPTCSSTSELIVLPCSLEAPSIPGMLNRENAIYVLHCLELAVQHCQQYSQSALVTGPVHKGIVNEAGIAFTGHTEYLAKLCGVDHVVMMLTNDNLRVALATTHMPLSEVPHYITQSNLITTIRILHQALQIQWGIVCPRIFVCGLNPHAGENGHLGQEELTVIHPVIEMLCREGLHLTGPLSADTAFVSENRIRCDAYLTMYHDQGLPVIKALGFGETVNITLGLPMIRTSVDHGVALDCAGNGLARPDSLLAAIQSARALLK